MIIEIWPSNTHDYKLIVLKLCWYATCFQGMEGARDLFCYIDEHMTCKIYIIQGG